MPSARRLSMKRIVIQPANVAIERVGINGWEAGIRTPIRRSRVCSLTVRRPPNDFNRKYNNGSLFAR
jgi:hypothetical protein